MALISHARKRAALALGGTAIACVVLAAQTHPERARLVFSHRLSRLDGAGLQAKLVEVTYGPGESSSPHTHPCPVIGYVLEGAVRMRVGGSPEAVYHVGEGFYEEANAQHLVSANASSTERARFLAYFTCDREAPLSVETHHAAR
jgi:quercetin dioxygenase-like cupin family protein